MHQPEFILVTGANGSGKTSLIEKHREQLEQKGFDIIIPDNILKQAHSLYEGSPVNDTIYKSLNNSNSFVLESPFQNASLVSIINELAYNNYKTSMIQLLVSDLQESLIRVSDRKKRGGLGLIPEEIKNNYAANMKNVAENYTMFEISHFVENAEVQNAKLLASFNYDKITYWKSNSSPSLKTLFNLTKQAKNLNAKAAKIIKANSDFGLKNTDHTKGLDFDWQIQ